MSQQPIIKIDYQPWQQAESFGKLALWEQPATLQTGTLPGFNDTQVYKKWFYMWASTVTYSINPTTFMEVTLGRTRNDLAGCFGPTNGVAPGLCTSSIPDERGGQPVRRRSDRAAAALSQFRRAEQRYYAYPGHADGETPHLGWHEDEPGPAILLGQAGSPMAPPNFPFPGWLNTNQNNDISSSVTKVKGSHTIKAGLYYTHSYKAQQSLAGTWQGSVSFANDANNSLDSSFGFANAALGVFTSYSQLSKYVEGNYVYHNIEGFIQDNWRVNSKLTLDFGMRLSINRRNTTSWGKA